MIEEGAAQESEAVEHTGKRIVMNKHGIKVMRWCQSCEHHEIIDKTSRTVVKCCQTGLRKHGHSVCAMWRMQTKLQRVGDLGRQLMYKPRAYFDWLLRTGTLGQVKDRSPYEYWKANVYGSSN